MVPLLVGAGIAAVLGLSGAAAAKETQKDAERILQEAKEMYDTAKNSLKAQQNKTEISLRRLGNEKYKLLTVEIANFVAAFKKYKNVQFQKSSGVNELNSLKFEDFSQSDFISIEALAQTGDSLKKGALAGGATGAAVALGAGAITVNTLLGTGTMSAVASVAGISGAAELAIAGVGGLAPALGIVAGPALLVGGFAAYCKADENLSKAKSARAEAEVAAEKMKTAEYLCAQIEQRSDMFCDLLYELAPRLQTSVEILRRIAGTKVTATVPKKRGAITRFFANLLNIELQEKYVTKTMKKNDYNLLNDKEKEFLAMSGAIAKAVKAVIDTPILDANGEVTENSERVYDSVSADLDERKIRYAVLVNDLQ